MGLFYPSFRAYIEDADDRCDKIKRIETTIDALLNQAAAVALEDDVQEYRLDDGQTTIKVIKRSVAQIMQSVQSMEKIKEIYKNQLNGRVNHLVNHEDTRRL